MLPNGAPAWKYLVKNDCLQVSMGARLRMPMVAKVTLSSAYLWEMGKASSQRCKRVGNGDGEVVS